MKPDPARWLIAGTRRADPDPCRCSRTRRCNPKYCPCWGRHDTSHLPRTCCAQPQEPTP